MTTIKGCSFRRIAYHNCTFNFWEHLLVSIEQAKSKNKEQAVDRWQNITYINRGTVLLTPTMGYTIVTSIGNNLPSNYSQRCSISNTVYLFAVLLSPYHSAREPACSRTRNPRGPWINASLRQSVLLWSQGLHARSTHSSWQLTNIIYVIEIKID